MLVPADISRAFYTSSVRGARVGLAACEYHLGLCYTEAGRVAPMALAAALAARGPLEERAACALATDVRRYSRKHLVLSMLDLWRELLGPPPCCQPWRALGALHLAQTGSHPGDVWPHLSAQRLRRVLEHAAAFRDVGANPCGLLIRGS